jgi:hypothetical protein
MSTPEASVAAKGSAYYGCCWLCAGCGAAKGTWSLKIGTSSVLIGHVTIQANNHVLHAVPVLFRGLVARLGFGIRKHAPSCS